MSNNQVNAQAGTTDLDKLRAEFEAVAEKYCINVERMQRFPDRYKYEHAEQMWQFWQEARRASPQPVAPSAQIADDHAGYKLREIGTRMAETLKVIARGLPNGTDAVVLSMVADWEKTAHHPSVPVQEQSDKVDERALFEAWHRRKFATKHSTGQPTRDMHNGVYAEKYGPEKQQLMWEAFQAGAALARQSCPPVQAGAPVANIFWNTATEFKWQLEMLAEPVLSEGQKMPLFASSIPAHPAQDGEDARDAKQWRELLESVMREMPQRFHRDNGNAPGHAHTLAGIWDEDNGALAGKECAWCKVWNAAKTHLAATQQGGSK